MLLVTISQHMATYELMNVTGDVTWLVGQLVSSFIAPPSPARVTTLPTHTRTLATNLVGILNQTRSPASMIGPR